MQLIHRLFFSNNSWATILVGNNTGGMKDTQDCINFCAEKGIQPDTEMVGSPDRSVMNDDDIIDAVMKEGRKLSQG